MVIQLSAKRFVEKLKTYESAEELKNTWERRTAIVSTLYFIGKGDVADAFKIAAILINDDQDLIHKATGWALRAVWRQGSQSVAEFPG